MSDGKKLRQHRYGMTIDEYVAWVVLVVLLLIGFWRVISL